MEKMKEEWILYGRVKSPDKRPKGPDYIFEESHQCF